MTPKLTRYYTMNSWNRETAPAFNLKIYNVIPPELQSKVFEVLETPEYWNEVDFMINKFMEDTGYTYTAGFNGRSGGYLVLYRISDVKFENDKIRYSVHYATIETDEVPKLILKKFTKLAKDIINLAIHYAKNCEVVEETIFVPKQIKVLKEVKK